MDIIVNHLRFHRFYSILQYIHIREIRLHCIRGILVFILVVQVDQIPQGRTVIFSKLDIICRDFQGISDSGEGSGRIPLSYPMNMWLFQLSGFGNVHIVNDISNVPKSIVQPHKHIITDIVFRIRVKDADEAPRLFLRHLALPDLSIQICWTAGNGRLRPAAVPQRLA